MPSNVKKAIFCLILSFLSMLLADVTDSFYFPDYDLISFAIFGIDLIWAAVIAWIVSDLYRKKNVIPSLYAVSAVMIYFLVSDFMDTGFTPSQIFNALEILLFLLPIYLLKTTETKLSVEKPNM